jgi:hypothetical protein
VHMCVCTLGSVRQKIKQHGGVHLDLREYLCG